jgi:purine-nucleoside phosphorylase
MKPSSTPDDLEAACRERPPLAVVGLGSGLGGLADALGDVLRVPYADLPGLRAATVPGHRGCLTLGTWAQVRVLVLEGRLHRYEGLAWEEVTRPIRLAAALGARVALLTNSAGGIRADFAPGTLVALRDQVDWTRPWAWRGPARPSPYSARLRGVLARAAEAAGLALFEGVYGAVTGPCYETPAEIHALRACGADVVGMSTAREAEAGAAAGLECAAVSCVTNRAAGLAAGRLHHEDVLASAAACAEKLATLVAAFLRLEKGQREGEGRAPGGQSG